MFNSSTISLLITSSIYILVALLFITYTPKINLDKISTKSDTTVVTLVKSKRDGKSLVNNKQKIKTSSSKKKKCCKSKTKPKKIEIKNSGIFKAPKPLHSKASASLSINNSQNSLKSTAKRGGRREINLFFKEIKKAIAKNKIYPKRARKRGIRGRVKATFTIEQNGSISNIALKGKRIFFNSARRAIKKIEPINTKNAPIPLPLRVSITIKFKLR